VTSQLNAALRAAAAGIHPDEAGAGLIISHGVFLHRDDFTRHIETAACISDGTPMAWIDWDLTCGTLGGLERERVAGLEVCRLPVADLRADTGSAQGPGGRRRSGGSAPWDPAVGRGGRLGVTILLWQ
jgi:hypothetical protein